MAFDYMHPPEDFEYLGEPSSDIECTVYRNDRRVHVTIHADDSNRLGLYDTNGKALLANGKDE